MVMTNTFCEFIKTFILIKIPNRTALQPECPTSCFAKRLLLEGVRDIFGCLLLFITLKPQILKGKGGKTKGFSSRVRELKSDL